MNIIFLMRYDAATIPGGDLIQVCGYISALEILGYKCFKIYSHNQLAKSCLKGDHSGDDLYCIVNLDRPIQASAYYRELVKRRLRYLIVPIHHPLDAVDKFERYIKGGSSSVLARLIPKFYAREKVKNFMRSVFYRELFFPACLDFFYDYKILLARIIMGAKGVVCIAEREKISLEKRLGVTIKNFAICPNAVEPPDIKPLENKTIDVIMVGRIEARKNQVGVLKALAGSGLSVMIIGQPLTQADPYFLEFKAMLEIDTNFSYIGPLRHEQVIESYRKAKLLINASYFEVTPLVDVEAYSSGCHVLTTMHGYSSEFIFCREIDPFDLSGLAGVAMEVIGEAVEDRKAIKNPVNWFNAVENILALGGLRDQL